MRVQKKSEGLTAMAVAGTNVVLLGWDLAAKTIQSKKVLGFAIQRTRHTDGERIYMPGMKTFKSVDPDPDPGALVSSREHPLQTFQWSDYSVAPNTSYTYRIVARRGQPASLADGPEVSLKVTTERTDLGRHAVFFNRGAVASQEYARRFQNRRPDEVGQAAFDWLSRGLVEGLEAYIGQAGKNDELFGAFFEFKNERIYDALKAARKRKAKVRILYDGKSEGKANEKAIDGHGVASFSDPRAHPGSFAHNKFLVLVRKGQPAEVWTGSTNLSQNGIFGHSNNAHVVRDAALAQQYIAYWRLLEQDLTKAPTAKQVMLDNPIPPPKKHETTAIFSPRRDLSVLDSYATMAGKAKRALFMTFAFGMNQRFVQVYGRKDKVLRFALMEKKGNGKTFKQQSKEIDRIRRLPNTVVSVGHRVELNNFDRWLEEIDRIVDEAHVLFVHTKYMLIDPLGKKPIVAVGSANFSAASTDTNDENMLVIEGNDAVADIYLGEFMRLFSHYAFRESLQFKDNQSQAALLVRKFLVESPSWIDGERPSASYFKPGTDRTLRRLYFSGQ
jgi:phosphatidylserine/phosphatidylglycerophosphate/cardiolipin synthase-like enzyme